METGTGIVCMTDKVQCSFDNMCVTLDPVKAHVICAFLKSIPLCSVTAMSMSNSKSAAMDNNVVTILQMDLSVTLKFNVGPQEPETANRWCIDFSETENRIGYIENISQAKE
jgi:hypothetical protein